MKKLLILFMIVGCLVGCDTGYNCDDSYVQSTVIEIIKEGLAKETLGVYALTDMSLNNIVQRDGKFNKDTKVCYAKADATMLYVIGGGTISSTPDIVYTTKKGIKDGKKVPVVEVYQVGTARYGTLDE